MESLVLGLFVVGCLVLAAVLFAKNRALRRRFAPVLDVDREIAARRAALQGEVMAQRAELERMRREAALHHEAATAQLRGDLARLQNAVHESQQLQGRVVAEAAARQRQLASDYEQSHAIFLRLKRELALLEQESEEVSVGLYRPSYSFDTPEKYKAELERIYQRQKQMVREDQATACPHEWTINGSKVEGRKMQKQLAKLMLRAFNGESDAATAQVKWNNVTKMEERVRKAHEAINGLGTVIGVSVTAEYAALAVAELKLTYEYELKKREVAEEQRAYRERMKEEERVQREAQKAEEEAAREEARTEKALAKIRAEMEQAQGAERQVWETKMKALEQQLAEAQAMKERAKSMAEQTKKGHVYVISNVGSFGENVYKIGMTRRLVPEDRVDELGDASVPFAFDIHAMMKCDDAPALENELHKQFAARQVNLMNSRKEFFMVSLEEIRAFAEQRGVAADWTMAAEAQQYRESLAMREARKQAGKPQPPRVVDPFPAHLGAAVM